YLILVGMANRERPITGLPVETAKALALLFEPCRRSGFDLFDHLGDRHRSRQLTKNVDMVLDRSRYQRRAIEVRQRADHVGVEVLPHVWRFEKWHAVLRAENEVDQNIGE